MLEDKSKAIIILLALAAVLSTLSEVCGQELYIIGFDIAVGSPEETSLRELAQQNGGTYLSAADATTPDQLSKALTLARTGGNGTSTPGIVSENDVNRPGSDYRNFDLSSPDPNLCMQACADDLNCKAFTYVKPGIQGTNARCWLKNAVPNAISDSCCMSGVKEEAISAQGPDITINGNVDQTPGNIIITISTPETQ